MPTTPDRDPGVREEEGTVYSDEGVAASAVGEVRYFAGKFSMFDGTGEYDPRTGGAASDPVIIRTLPGNLVVAPGTTRLHRCTIIPDGIELKVDGGGEFLVL